MSATDGPARGPAERRERSPGPFVGERAEGCARLALEAGPSGCARPARPPEHPAPRPPRSRGAPRRGAPTSPEAASAPRPPRGRPPLTPRGDRPRRSRGPERPGGAKAAAPPRPGSAPCPGGRRRRGRTRPSPARRCRGAGPSRSSRCCFPGRQVERVTRPGECPPGDRPAPGLPRGAPSLCPPEPPDTSAGVGAPRRGLTRMRGPERPRPLHPFPVPPRHPTWPRPTAPGGGRQGAQRRGRVPARWSADTAAGRGPPCPCRSVVPARPGGRPRARRDPGGHCRCCREPVPHGSLPVGVAEAGSRGALGRRCRFRMRSRLWPGQTLSPAPNLIPAALSRAAP